MKLQLIKGRFERDEALELLQQLLQVKIKYHEQKITRSISEEDIKMREQRIKQLQHEFAELRQILSKEEQWCELESEVNVY